MTDTAAVAGLIVEAWSYVASDTVALRDPLPLDQAGARDWAAVLLTERFRAGIGGAVLVILERTLSLPVAGLCVRDVIRACNEAYAPIAGLVADAAAAGETFDVAAAVAEAEPFLRQRISLAIERSVRRG